MILYYCKYNGLGFNGSCDCVWRRREARQRFLLKFRPNRRRQLERYASLGFTPYVEGGESFEDFERRVYHSLRHTMIASNLHDW